jgi:hypothetical protein
VGKIVTREAYPMWCVRLFNLECHTNSRVTSYVRARHRKEAIAITMALCSDEYFEKLTVELCDWELTEHMEIRY